MEERCQVVAESLERQQVAGVDRQEEQLPWHWQQLPAEQRSWGRIRERVATVAQELLEVAEAVAVAAGAVAA